MNTQSPDLFEHKQLWFGLISVLFVASWLFHSFFWQDYLLENHSEYARPIDLRYGYSTFYSAVFGFGFGTTLTLMWVVRGRIKSIFKPSRAKLIWAFVFILLYPIAVFAGLPIPLSLALIAIDLNEFGEANVLAVIELKIFAVILAYLLACLYVAGIHNWKHRLGVIVGFMWTGYAAFALFVGLVSFTA